MTDVSTSPLVAGYREGLAEGRLLIQRCHACERPNMYPRYVCPFCQSDDLGWRESAGAGVLHSFTVVRAVPPRGFEEALPYGLGVVKLDEGVQLLGRLHPSADGDWAGYACDARVSFAPATAEEIAVRPVAWFGLTEELGA